MTSNDCQRDLIKDLIKISTLDIFMRGTLIQPCLKVIESYGTNSVVRIIRLNRLIENNGGTNDHAPCYS